MNDPPPSYAQAIGECVSHSSNDRTATYAVPPEQLGDVHYTISNERILLLTVLGRDPIQCPCSKCHSMIVTNVRRTSGSLIWLLCGILIIMGCWLGCCLIPFCIRDMYNSQHYCPNCDALIGEYHPL